MVARGRSMNAPTLWRFETVHSFGAVGNLYQKMHFAGSNLSTDPKYPKCIYKILKNFRVEKSGEISRNLRFSCALALFSCLHLNQTRIMAGMAGFEPTDAGVKVPCLTAWRHPNMMYRSIVP